ncbi:MAG: hypothetical protein Fues2KO_29470 [Fuerstiella sp.]
MNQTELECLFDAVKDNDVRTLSKLLNKHPDAVDAICDHHWGNPVENNTPHLGQTLLMYAISRGNNLVANLLLDRGADVVEESPYTSAIELAVGNAFGFPAKQFSDWMALTSRLIDEGADVSTALGTALNASGVYKKQLEFDKNEEEKLRFQIIRMLLERGAKLDVRIRGRNLRSEVELNRNLYSAEIRSILGIPDKKRESKSLEKQGPSGATSKETFDNLFFDHLLFPLKKAGFIARGQSLYFQDTKIQVALIRGGGRLSRPGCAVHILALRKRYMRETSSKLSIPAEPPRYCESYPFLMPPEAVSRTGPEDWGFDPYSYSAKPYGVISYHETHPDLLVDALKELRNQILDRWIPWGHELRPADIIGQLEPHVKKWWVARIWSEDCRNFIADT